VTDGQPVCCLALGDATQKSSRSVASCRPNWRETAHISTPARQLHVAVDRRGAALGPHLGMAGRIMVDPEDASRS